MDLLNQFKATLQTEIGKMDYNLWAFMSFEGEQYLVMRAEENKLLADDLIVLHVGEGEQGHVLNVVDDWSPFKDALYQSLGIEHQIQ